MAREIDIKEKNTLIEIKQKNNKKNIIKNKRLMQSFLHIFPNSIEIPNPPYPINHIKCSPISGSPFNQI